MKSYVTSTLPPAIQSIFEAPPGITFEQLAGQAVDELQKVKSPAVQSEAAVYILKFLQGRGDRAQQELVEQALRVMDKFPHFPRPRAAVALKALGGLTRLRAA